MQLIEKMLLFRLSFSTFTREPVNCVVQNAQWVATGRQMQFFLNFCFLEIKFKQLQNFKLDLMKNAQLSPVGVKYISAQNCIIMHTTKTVRKNFYAEIVIQLRRP